MPSNLEQRVRFLLEDFEKKDAIALLKLAFLKHNCMMNPPMELMPTLESFMWFSKGWKDAKEIHKSSAIDIVANRVASFL